MSDTLTDAVKSAGDDIIQLQFYKNPIFITFAIYIGLLISMYVSVGSNRKKAIFSDKFMDDTGDIHWLHILSYPYDFGKSMANKAKIVLTSPITLYLLIGVYLTKSIVNPLQKSYQAYFYSVMFSYLCIAVLFSIHMFIFNFIIKPQNTKVELRIGDPDKPKTYSSFYYTQWLLVITLSPLIIGLVVYIIRKLSLK